MIKDNLEVVITSYNQGETIIEAIDSINKQSILPKRVIIVDDGTTDANSIEILKSIENTQFNIPVIIHYQTNSGVSTARNQGILITESEFVLIFDGDDILKETYIEKVLDILEKNEKIVAASSWMETFGTLKSIVKPTGGDLISFLPRNCCPATHIVRRKAWDKCGGYDETMKSGFEDWEYFLGLLETKKEAHIAIVEEALMKYRTTPASSNVKSMDKRLVLMNYIIQKHYDSYKDNLVDTLLGIEATSINRLNLWEQEMLNSISNDEISDVSRIFLASPSYGDGGMASAVRICTRRFSQ